MHLQLLRVCLPNFQNRLKIFACTIGSKTSGKPGEIMGTPHKKIEVACGDGTSLLISEVQPFGKKRMDTGSFLNGNNIEIGEILS